MSKGTIFIVVPCEATLPHDFMDGWEFPEMFSTYLDGKVHLMYLPEGGFISIGEQSNETINAIHELIHKMVDNT